MTLQNKFVDTDVLPNDGLPYTGEVVFNSNGLGHFVLDLEAMMQNFERIAVPARKNVTTLVLKAKEGQHTAQVFPSGKETEWEYTTVEGDAIFIQGDVGACKQYIETGIIPEGIDGHLDIYVPDNAKHSPDGRLKYDDLEKEGYEFEAGTQNTENTEAKVYSPRAMMLFPPNTNKQPVCIKIEGKQEKFFPPDAAFKLLDGNISGMNPDVVNTWTEMPSLTADPSTDHDNVGPE